MNFTSKALVLFFINLACVFNVSTATLNDQTLLAKCPFADGFDFPVGKPNSKGYYNAQKFGKNYHLGEDWNGTGGGNTDMGDSVYAISAGIVASAEDLKGGWGKVVRIYHKLDIKKEGTKQKPHYIESVYAHFKEVNVKAGQVVKKGEQIGTIGNADGLYLAHC